MVSGAIFLSGSSHFWQIALRGLSWRTLNHPQFVLAQVCLRVLYSVQPCFLIFINDLPNCISHSTLRMFADDCLLYKTIRSPQDAIDLQQDLFAMQTWEDTWLMRFNISKCFVMRILEIQNDDYQLHDSILNSVNHCKYLGVTLQSNLRWSKHIEGITANANSILGMIHRNIIKHPNKSKYKYIILLSDPS